MLRNELQQNAFETWSFLKKHAGIDEKYYDNDLPDGLKEQLGLPIEGRLDTLLKKSKVTNEQFLKAFFQIAQPYTLMASDILAMFSEAGAKESTENIAIEFDFDHKIDGLKFEIDDFRQFQNQLQRIKKRARTRVWTGQSLWDASKIFQQYRNADGALRIHDQTDKWLLEVRDGRTWPTFFPPYQKTGIAALDERLQIFWSLVEEVSAETAKFGQRPWELSRAVRDRVVPVEEREAADRADDEEDVADEGWSATILQGPDSDHWADYTFELLRNCMVYFQERKHDPTNQEVLTLTQKMDDLLGTIRVEVSETESLENVLVDFLQLPVWKLRHEVYGVWVGTRMIMAIGFSRCRIFHQDGVMKFSFSGTHLAAVPHPTDPLHLVSEIRTRAKTKLIGKGRKFAIQPDYRLVREPILAAESGVLVVECKQFRRPSNSNFTAATIDYANNCPNAHVILVNYGPADQERVLRNAPNGISDRATVIGEFRPDNPDSLEQFSNIISDTVEQNQSNLPTSTPTRNPLSSKFPESDSSVATIRLVWGTTPKDLDLHLVLREENGHCHHVYYGEKGHSSELPWAMCDEDIRSGKGPEIISVFKWVPGTYDIYVDNYSEEASLGRSEAIVELIRADTESISAFCPTIGSGKCWRVLQIDTRNNTIEILNRLQQDCPQ